MKEEILSFLYKYVPWHSYTIRTTKMLGMLRKTSTKGAKFDWLAGRWCKYIHQVNIKENECHLKDNSGAK